MQLSPGSGMVGVIEVLLYTVISGIFAVAVGVLTSRHADRRNASTREKVSEIASSVNNGHDSPLREDLDDIRAAVHEIRRDQYEMRSEQTEMRSDIRDLRDRLSIEHDEISRLEGIVTPRIRTRRKGVQ